MLSLLLATSLAADCPEPDLDAAFLALAGGSQVEAWLGQVETSLTCAKVDRRMLARFWLLEGAVLLAEGDEEGALQSLAAARRVAPALWEPSLPEAVRDAWDRASAPGNGRVEVADAVPRDVELLVDGRPLETLGATRAGLHAVQLVRDGEVVFGKVVFVPDGGVYPVDPGPLGRPSGPDDDGGLVLHAGIGVTGAFGASVEHEDLAQPGLRVEVPVEVGVTFRTGSLAVGAGLGAHTPVNGRYVVVNGKDEVVARPLAMDAWVGAGVESAVCAGLQVGLSAPSRTFVRADLAVGGKVRVHLRPALQRVAGGPDLKATAEPAVTALVSFRP
ncbi:MAG: hypothetical protein H6734_08345 [Alphaproteobacteria bacterium]|nr:hypothetical protein [Alphaproteobacteria bacterium]